VLADPIPPRLNASSFFRGATSAAKDEAEEQNATSAPWHTSSEARDRPAALSPSERYEKYAAAASGTKLVPSQPSAISPVSRSMAGPSVARYTGIGYNDRIDSRIGRASLPGNGTAYSRPVNETRSPDAASRTISTVSRIRVSGRPNGTPCSPSITWGPEAPRPSRNRPPEMFDSVIAARAMAIGVRVPSWMIPDPSSIREVRAARYPSTDGASAPHASATQQMSRPSFSASRTNSTVSSQSPETPDASIVVAVRIKTASKPRHDDSASRLISASVAPMLVSNSRSRTNTIFCSLSGICSIAIDNPERPGPTCTHCLSSVPP